MKTILFTLTTLLLSSNAFASNVRTIKCDHQQNPRICTMEFRPTTCSIEHLSAHGSNPCMARVSLEMAICAEMNAPEVEVDFADVTCGASLNGLKAILKK